MSTHYSFFMPCLSRIYSISVKYIEEYYYFNDIISEERYLKLRRITGSSNDNLKRKINFCFYNPEIVLQSSIGKTDSKHKCIVFCPYFPELKEQFQGCSIESKIIKEVDLDIYNKVLKLFYQFNHKILFSNRVMEQKYRNLINQIKEENEKSIRLNKSDSINLNTINKEILLLLYSITFLETSTYLLFSQTAPVIC